LAMTVAIGPLIAMFRPSAGPFMKTTALPVGRWPVTGLKAKPR
jgi:hypothetical protein